MVKSLSLHPWYIYLPEKGKHKQSLVNITHTHIYIYTSETQTLNPCTINVHPMNQRLRLTLLL